MNWLKTFLKALLISVTALQITACSKTVQWEEEVPLNTGETIWVKRTVEYTSQGGAGNPLDTKYRPSKNETFEFKWKNKTYQYKGPTGFKVLAISPTGVPVLVRNANAGAWDATNGYKCTIPFYVQFVPDESGTVWTWPSQIEPWLYRLPTNLLLDYGQPDHMQSRYTQAEKMQQGFWNDPQLKSIQLIDPEYTGDLCKKKEK
jgi:hypothetical protein